MEDRAHDPGVTAWELLLRTHAALVPKLARDVEAATSLPLSWYDVLFELVATGQPALRLQQLSERVVLSRTRVSRVIDAMDDAALVSKTPDPGDGRATLVAITKQGRDRFRRAAPVYLRSIETRFSSILEKGEAEVISEALRRVLEDDERAQP